MKTVVKKLLSLALVAILLVSAVPFQAHATETTEEPITVSVKVYVNEKYTATKPITVNPGETIALTADYGMSLIRDKDNRSFNCWKASDEGDLDYGWLKEHKDSYWLELYINETPLAHKHEYTSEITTPATCTEKGVKTFTCKNSDGKCDKLTYTEEIPATGHEWGEWTEENGKYVRSCKNGCGATESKSAVKFVSDGETVKTVAIKEGETFGTLPTPTKKTGYDFVGWFTEPNGAGTKLKPTTVWKGETFTYYAKWQENPDGTKDGLSYLTIRMRLYTGSNQTDDVFLDKVELDDDTNILQWLYDNEKRISDAIFDNVDSTEYEWLDRVYYNNDAAGELTSQATLADGDKTVYVKVHAVASTETNVQLYIHQYNTKTKSYDTLKIVDVGGYKEGDTITLTKMATVVKKHYSYTAIKGLYTDSTWKQMINGQNPTASSSITVSSNGTVKYHVLLNGATAASSSKADSTNPKTGDMIMVPVMVMLASAAAATFVYLNSKKRAAR